MTGHVFISYSRSDRGWVERLVDELTKAGIPVWWDSEPPTGDPWEPEFSKALKACAAFVVVMTPAARESAWVHREINIAERRGKPMVPLLAEGVPFARLSDRQSWDISGGTVPSKLIDHLRRLLAGGVPPPDGPWARHLARGEPDPTRVFINYRHNDQDVAAHWLYRETTRVLTQDFDLPPDSVFIDHNGIAAGRDLEEAIEDAIGRSRVLLAVIGRNWRDVDASGRSRLQDPDDYVRREIELALKMGVHVVPVLVGAATMPTADQLPDSIRALTRRRAITLRVADFEADATALARELGCMIKAG